MARPFTTPRGEPASNPEKVRRNAQTRESVHSFEVSSSDSAGCGTMRVLEVHGSSVFNEGRFSMAEDSRVNGFAWFLAGLGIGALTGILYAPKSGRETREDLANSAREGSEYLRNRSKQVAEQVGVAVD